MAIRKSDGLGKPLRRSQITEIGSSIMLAGQCNTTQRPAVAEGDPLG
jgi:hypothetical protein